jgi:hypothetical protein
MRRNLIAGRPERPCVNEEACDRFNECRTTCMTAIAEGPYPPSQVSYPLLSTTNALSGPKTSTALLGATVSEFPSLTSLVLARRP